MILIDGQRYECEPAVEAYIKQLEEENDHLLDKIQSFYKNEKLDLIERGSFLRKLNDEIDENAKCRMAVTADELIEFIEEFEPVTEGELVARLSELEEENARLEEGYQKSLGVIAATDCAECKKQFEDEIKVRCWELKEKDKLIDELNAEIANINDVNYAISYIRDFCKNRKCKICPISIDGRCSLGGLTPKGWENSIKALDEEIYGVKMDGGVK